MGDHEQSYRDWVIELAVQIVPMVQGAEKTLGKKAPPNLVDPMGW